MKKVVNISFSFLALFIFLCGFDDAGNKATTFSANEKGFAVIELFTSEGCSSCPAAEKLVASVAAENLTSVFILAYHVDYWNRLGWKDGFSNAAYTARQTRYAEVFNLPSAYTPQIVVNGKTEFVGSNAIKLKSVMRDDLANAT